MYIERILAAYVAKLMHSVTKDVNGVESIFSFYLDLKFTTHTFANKNTVTNRTSVTANCQW